MVENCSTSEFVTNNISLRFIPGQRGRSLLCFNNFTFAKNNICGETTYWNCRSRRTGSTPCKARITTTKQPNGLFKNVVLRSIRQHLEVECSLFMEDNHLYLRKI